MLLRIRSPAGTSRLNVEASTPGEELAKMMVETLVKAGEKADESTLRLSNQPGSSAEQLPLSALVGRTVGDMGFSHGDLLFLSYKAQTADPASHPTDQPSSSGSTSTSHPAQPDPSHPHTHTDPPLPNTIPLADLSKVAEPPVDVYWSKQTGKIERKRDPVFCRHNDNAMCDYCMPLEPYDPRYQAEKQIKHLSYHAHLRKLYSSRSASATASSASEVPPLTPLSLSVITPCPSGAHEPYPKGICSSCQPSALTLTSQPFRMVDHIVFSSPSIIENLISVWRKTGVQRLAFLIGRYEKYDAVPMGVQCVVEAVWEPQQEGEVDGLTVETPWQTEDRVQEIAQWCDKELSVVGMMYTDLTPTEEDISKNVYKRHAQSFTASSLEMLLSAAYQVSHPLPTRSSPTGHFSSRFITVCITGNAEGAAEPIAWQATEQAEAMVKAGIVEASVDPGVVRVRRPGKDEYIPEVFYSFKNEYGVQVKQPARPTFPVEYLFVNITHGFPNNPNPLFLSSSFPTENRPGLSDQTIESVMTQLYNILKPEAASIELNDTATWTAKIKLEVARWLSDWHLVAFLCFQGLFSLAEQKTLCRASTVHAHPDDAMALEELFATDGWQTLLTIMTSSISPNEPSGSRDRNATPSAEFDAMRVDSPRPGGSSANAGGSAGGGGGSAGGERICPHCTFVNEHSGTDCEICGLPLSG